MRHIHTRLKCPLWFCFFPPKLVMIFPFSHSSLSPFPSRLDLAPPQTVIDVCSRYCQPCCSTNINRTCRHWSWRFDMSTLNDVIACAHAPAPVNRPGIVTSLPVTAIHGYYPRKKIYIIYKPTNNLWTCSWINCSRYLRNWEGVSQGNLGL